MILAVALQQKFELCSREFDIASQEVIHRRAIDDLYRCTGILMREVEFNALLLGHNIDYLLKGLVAGIARTLEVALTLLLVGVVEHLCKLSAKEDVILIFGRFKSYLSHFFVYFTCCNLLIRTILNTITPESAIVNTPPKI